MAKFSVQGSNPGEFLSVLDQPLTSYITSTNWSPSLYNDSKRDSVHFKETEMIGLDVDEGCDLETAKELFKDYKHLIGTTRSHQIEKNGKVCDRFRVILFLSKPITDLKEFKSTWLSLYKLYPFLDRQTSDATRMFYPCQEIVQINASGRTIDPTPYVQPEPTSEASEVVLEGSLKGSLSRSTLEFLINGAPQGAWNGALYKAAKDSQEQGYSEGEFLERAEKITGHLDETDLKTVSSAYKDAPKYEPRLLDSELILTPSLLIKETLDYIGDPAKVKGQATGLGPLDKLLGGGLRKGEVTALHAEAKVGKSSLLHYIQKMQIDSRIPFGYASREMRPKEEVLPNYLSIHYNLNLFKREELITLDQESIIKEVADWPVYFAGGFGLFSFSDFKSWALRLREAFGVEYFYIDHLHFMLEDPEDHAKASKLVKDLKTLAVEEDIAIFIIIQPNKLMDGQRLGRGTLKGGSAIGQAIDNLLTMSRVKDDDYTEVGDNVSKLSVEFARHKVARTGYFYLKYDPDSMTFVEIILEREPDQNPLYLPTPGQWKPRSIK